MEEAARAQSSAQALASQQGSTTDQAMTSRDQGNEDYPLKTKFKDADKDADIVLKYSVKITFNFFFFCAIS